MFLAGGVSQNDVSKQCLQDWALGCQLFYELNDYKQKFFEFLIHA